MYSRNVGSLSVDYTALCARRCDSAVHTRMLLSTALSVAQVMRVERRVGRCLLRVSRELRLFCVNEAIDCGLTFDSLRQFVDSDTITYLLTYRNRTKDFFIGKMAEYEADCTPRG